MESVATRLWRLRRLHQHVDAELGDATADGVDLRFFYNGEPAYTRRWPTPAEAIAEASAKRAELEREGWMPHW